MFWIDYRAFVSWLKWFIATVKAVHIFVQPCTFLRNIDVCLLQLANRKVPSPSIWSMEQTRCSSQPHLIDHTMEATCHAFKNVRRRYLRCQLVNWKALFLQVIVRNCLPKSRLVCGRSTGKSASPRRGPNRKINKTRKLTFSWRSCHCPSPCSFFHWKRLFRETWVEINARHEK